MSVLKKYGIKGTEEAGQIALKLLEVIDNQEKRIKKLEELTVDKEEKNIEELKEKAIKLGIAFPGNIGYDTLAKKIEEKEAEEGE